MGSIQAFLLVVIGVVTGPIFDQGYLQPLLWVGSFLTVFSLMMTSICTKYWQLILAQGVCVGLGSGCLFVPSIAVVATYFTTKRAFATGIAVGGSSIGGIIFPIMFRRLQPVIGFGRVGNEGDRIHHASTPRHRNRRYENMPPAKARPFALPAVKNKTFSLASFGMLVGFIGLYVPMFYIQTYALTKQITSNTDYAFYLLSILNAGSFFGRILPNFLADKTGLMNMLVPLHTSSWDFMSRMDCNHGCRRH